VHARLLALLEFFACSKPAAAAKEAISSLQCEKQGG